MKLTRRKLLAAFPLLALAPVGLAVAAPKTTWDAHDVQWAFDEIHQKYGIVLVDEIRCHLSDIGQMAQAMRNAPDTDVRLMNLSVSHRRGPGRVEFHRWGNTGKGSQGVPYRLGQLWVFDLSARKLLLHEVC
jgi:hypothetical protein